MQWIVLVLFITAFGLIQHSHSTCVLESDFGFILNCAFKKSGLFRVRNLGGVKASIGLGFSLGDELGFKESISNTEMNMRRSAQVSKMQAQLIQATQKQQEEKQKLNLVDEDGKTKETEVDANTRSDEASARASPKVSSATGKTRQLNQFSSGEEIPPFKPISPAAERPSISGSVVAKPAFTGVSPSNRETPSIAKLMAVVAIPKKKVNQLGGPQGFSDRLLSIDTSSNDNDRQALNFNNKTKEAVDLAFLQKNDISNQFKIKSTTSKSTTRRPVPPRKPSSIGKVMNAPKEYYPVGYDKNFDDNFAARVELPETSFYCEHQKHFPGLYADEDLGCMVFHVCALTEDGLIMKSFLCPESTLYDQTILKCNWWFYVDCKNSKNLYDSNIPISKSYQLMKALTFFSNYKKETSTKSSSEN
ncbi:uncharacterized protein mtg isoform X2 [Euwallacea fornicatus]|uniref:uncharacterized protein mtg isoform X2 n=1 Tax=Euwallacea fornicatus TaxID=995702 RepID=UPI00338F1515